MSGIAKEFHIGNFKENKFFKGELERMEAQRTIGSMIEWNRFKGTVISLLSEVLSLRVKSESQLDKIESLERQIENYKELNLKLKLK